MIKETALGCLLILMALVIRESGRIIKLQGGGLSGTLMGMSMMENGKMIRRMALESILIALGQCTRVIGLIICKADTARRFGMMAASMKDNISKEKSKAQVFMFGLTKAITTDNGVKTQ